MRRAGWVIWGACGVFALCVAGFFVWFLAEAAREVDKAQEDPFRTTSKISCGKALTWAHGRLPDKARDQDCEYADWMDDLASGTFRMERAEVDAWIRDSWPAAEPGPSCTDADRCVHVEFVTADGVPAEGYASPTPDDVVQPVALTIEVVHEDGKTSLVRFRAWTS